MLNNTNARITDLEAEFWMLWDITTDLQIEMEKLKDENKRRVLERCEGDKQHEHVERNTEKKPTLWT